MINVLTMAWTAHFPFSGVNFISLSLARLAPLEHSRWIGLRNFCIHLAYSRVIYKCLRPYGYYRIFAFSLSHYNYPLCCSLHVTHFVQLWLWLWVSHVMPFPLLPWYMYEDAKPLLKQAMLHFYFLLAIDTL